MTSSVSPSPRERVGRVSARLCAAIALAIAVVAALGTLKLREVRHAELLAEAERTARIARAAVGAERGADALRSRLAELSRLGVNGLRAVPDGPPVLRRSDRELLLREDGLEVRVSLARLESSLRALLLRQLGLGAALLAAGTGAAWLFARRSPTIRAADQLDEYARRLERQNQELQGAKRDAEQADRAKTEFLANVSHELRTPLTAILGFTDVLIERASTREGNAEHLETARTIQRNGHYLYRLLAGLLDYADLEAGRMPIVWQACSPADVLRDVEIVARPDAERKRLRLRTEIDPELPDTVTSDATRVRQVMLELVSNAIKFTEDGSVSLRASLLREGFAHPRVAFDVIDTGVGIGGAKLDRVFESFAQGDGSRTRRYAGVGLGLALSRLIARKLRGELTVVSTPLEGSAFRLTLPFAPPESASEGAAVESPVEEDGRLECRLLVAEDAEDNRKLIQHILVRAGASLTLVEDGERALQLALDAWRCDEPYDAILMDLQMPGTDGVQATRALRLAGYPGVIVALTADARKVNREECLKAGCDEFLTKPIDGRRLVAALRSLTKPSPQLS